MEQVIHPADEAGKLWLRWQESAAEQGVDGVFDDDFISALKVVWEGSDYVASVACVICRCCLLFIARVNCREPMVKGR